MLIALQILFWLPLLLIAHSYVFFPLILKFLAKNKKNNQIFYTKDDDLPRVSILMAAYNEEKVIEQKILSVVNSDYPIEKIEFLIGSDNSTDRTNEIVECLAEKYNFIKFFKFTQRTGKIGIINRLIDNSKFDIVISTDAKVIFTESTIFNLVKHFKNPDISIVGGILINQKFDNKGISHQENLYMNREFYIKYYESVIWQSVIGIYGALYAIRKKDFTKVPENFLVDDFFITFKTIEKNKKVIFDIDAIAIENLPHSLKEEFRRKIRIATGNFQNLRYFYKHILKPHTPVGFCFISHKVLRWTAPFLFIISLITLFFLLKIKIYQTICIVILTLCALPVFDFILNKISINIKFLRLITHFFAMNVALIIGFIKSIKGVKQSIWQPSKR